MGFSSCFWPRCIADSDEANGGYGLVAACDGKFTLSANDSDGFYGNNVGFANISLSWVN